MGDWTFGIGKIVTGAVDLACDTAKGAVGTVKNSGYAIGSLLTGDTQNAQQYAKAAGTSVTNTVKNAGTALGNVWDGATTLPTAVLDTVQKGAHAADEFISGNNTATQEPAKAETQTQTSAPTTTASTETTEPPETPIEVIQTTETAPMFETASKTTAAAETTEPPETPIEVIQTTEMPPMFETVSTTTDEATQKAEEAAEAVKKQDAEKAEEAKMLEEAADEEQLIAKAGEQTKNVEEAEKQKVETEKALETANDKNAELAKQLKASQDAKAKVTAELKDANNEVTELKTRLGALNSADGIATSLSKVSAGFDVDSKRSAFRDEISQRVNSGNIVEVVNAFDKQNKDNWFEPKDLYSTTLKYGDETSKEKIIRAIIERAGDECQQQVKAFEDSDYGMPEFYRLLNAIMKNEASRYYGSAQ